MENQIVKVEKKSNPDTLLELAINNKLEITTLRELVLLKKEWDAEQSRRAYIESMAEFQKECPVIIKSKEGGRTKSGDVAYKFAPMDMILTTKAKNGMAVKDLIAQNGFSYTFDTPITNDKGVEVKMTITHIAGHSELSQMTMPFVEKTGVMSPPQVVASTMSYAKRYCFCNGFGIITGDEDNDAQGRELLEEQFMELVKEWGSNQEIIAVADTIEANATYRDFLSKLPKSEDVQRFKKCLEKVERGKRDMLWKKFEKSCISIKWEGFLKELESKTQSPIEEAKIQTESPPQANIFESPNVSKATQ